MTTLAELPSVFRQKAAMLRIDGGADQPAVAWERAAEEVERALRGHLDEPLSLDAAATESGYTRRHLKRLTRAGKLTIQDDMGSAWTGCTDVCRTLPS